MPPAATIAARRSTTASLGLLFPLLLCASVLVILVPVPALVLDLLLTANITAAILILLTSIYVRRPLDFSVFPSLLLATTLSRLVLNIASTRLVLSRGAIDGDLAAGGVIRAFGDFVAGGQILIGLVIFAIILAVQFLVITKGSTRISEVAARFALDGLPGRQAAIDADLHAGAITHEHARQRRAELSLQADFYGAMDGAGKFVRGDAVAGLFITAINIGGGLCLGVLQEGMPLEQALDVFTRLTIGDGLVSQVPALLISLAAGLIMTRGSEETNLSEETINQLVRFPEALGISACFLFGLAFTGLPAVPMLILSATCGGLAWTLKSRPETVEPLVTPTPVKPDTKPDPLAVFPLELEMGFGLIRLTDKAHGGDLLDRINRIRQKLAQELGLILPAVRIRDNLRLKAHQYRIHLHGVPIAHGDAYPERCLAIDVDSSGMELPGIRGLDPAFQRPAVWIEMADREQAIEQGFHVVDAAPVIVTHLSELIRRYCDELLSQQQVHQLLERQQQQTPQLVAELIPGSLKVSQLHQILVNLLRERVSIRNLESILEILATATARTTDTLVLTETVRSGLRRVISQQYRDSQAILRVVILEPELEEQLTSSIQQQDQQLSFRLSPGTLESITQAIDQELSRLSVMGYAPVILTSSPIRAGLRQLISGQCPHAAVLSYPEITPDTRVEPYGRVGLAQPETSPPDFAALSPFAHR